ncbi:2-methoxy-6-polyprenyl-1,4-benzoquinol methylase, mitochondrial [Paenibacillus allorhizoplanae]|uniref:2-methoxy-6-polyprenyl-1,4-benzoquinol methylase, mitochondrial n=1 Tax=Paenibacillus allorhizoplanae TaxID=2905648 RepID=A0ABN8GHY5_9BACL|nr:class I SAM-dependent methyltransferase [Paenibacillus allorhizoplanae]CAH1203716.1 2-methoxy-6-polyprenyl-1,4-benzoquinol methylase, mitochondrial [Paenibacillus allorhizoplanae]
MIEHIRTSNVQRFTGFGTLYDESRPTAPQEMIKILTAYLGNKPQTVVDVGCGTGLSSFLWLNDAERIIGVEPSDDMRAVALAKWENMNKPEVIQFVKGLSHELDLPSNSTDVVTCSQSFHWMEPQSTLREFARILRPGGVFAAYDCDWPPVIDWEIEQQYTKLTSLGDKRAAQLAPKHEQAHKWNKDEHLKQIQSSGLFRYAREIVFHNWESCDATRYANLALSQGSLQSAIKLGAKELEAEAAAFRQLVGKVFAGEERSILFGYRMRVGIV